jgi:hypothetical protein
LGLDYITTFQFKATDNHYAKGNLGHLFLVTILNNKKNSLVVCKVGLKMIILRDNVIRKH